MAALKHDMLRPLFHPSDAQVRTAAVRYIGRAASASTATAAFWIHANELQNLLDECLDLGR